MPTTQTDAIRPFRREDIPHVLALFRTAFVRNGNGVPELDSYFDRLFFKSPWRDPDLPSFVHLDSRGEVIGFVGVQPRPLLLNGRPLRAAVATKLMVSPEAGEPLAPFRLLGRVFAGPQDLLLSDLSNDAGRRIWEGLGGTTALLYSLEWQRPVRPARHSLSWLAARGVPAVITATARPVCAIADALFARMGRARFRAATAGYATTELAVDTVASRFPALSADRVLRPVYDERSLRWLLGVAAQNEPHRTLRGRLVRDPRGEVAGWFLYFVEPGGASEVLQLVARKGTADAVVHLLLADARDHGAVMLSGRLEPRVVREMSLQHCYFRQVSHWTLAHSRRPEVLDAILRGDAFLSRLEGEW